MTFRIGTPYSRNAGYFMNDDRPGGGKKSEADIRTCPHCEKIIKMQLWKDNGAFCRKCNAPICAQCGDRALTFGCEPFKKKFDQHVEAMLRRKQLSRGL